MNEGGIITAFANNLDVPEQLIYSMYYFIALKAVSKILCSSSNVL